ncbi:MAG: AbrB/MazE/SpoVT family DNA-binding domain-containing protein [Caldilineaceae bacterium]
MREQVIITNNEATLRIPRFFVEELHIQDGDELEFSIIDGALIVRPLSETEREAKLDSIIQGLLRKRKSVYEALASGVE